MSGFRQPGRNRERINVTATTLTLTKDDVGKTITNVGAGNALTITLPDPTVCVDGGDILVLSCADQNLTISANTNGDIITLNDTAANSVAFSTSSQKAGGGFLLTCVGTKWHVAPLTEGQTITVTT